MSRITYRGRDPWSHNGRRLRPDLPLAVDGEDRFQRFVASTARRLAIVALLYFGAQLLRGLLS